MNRSVFTSKQNFVIDQNIYNQVFKVGSFCFVSVPQVKTYAKLLIINPSKDTSKPLMELENWINRSCSNQGATKQVSDTVVAVFQIYDRHISNFLRIIKRINFGRHIRRN